MAPGAPIHVTPNGVDCEYFMPSNDDEEPFSLVFTGAMDVPANMDACIFVATEILPRVISQYPGARLYLVGKDPAPAVRRLASNRVVVTGTVPDVRPFLARAQVVIAPLRGGSGTRLKILEAMAMGKAIVATGIGAEGIEYTPRENLLIADSPESIGAAILDLFGDAGLRSRLGAAGRRLVCERYTWNLLEAKLDELYSLGLARAKTRLGA
jgi:glycosyltransferase involved in cell wall biosynthesis